MSDVKHTPGPWAAFYKHKYDEWHVSLPVQGSSMKIALCPDGIRSENREADAHLIAAAPEMLDALKELADLMDDIVSGNYAPDSFTSQPARAAIRKAEGRTP